ncbi:MAG: cell division protein FtsH, partial [Clostridiales bacterium]|nr:cell division protein FtsH [Clostridiales bacterium]
QGYSENVASLIDEEVNRLVQQGYNKAKLLLQENINRLHNVAEALLEREKLEAEEFEEIFAAV